MLFSTQTKNLFATMEISEALDIFKNAGFPAIDYSMYETTLVYDDNYREHARKLKALATDRGIVFNQSHAPFGGGAEFYTQKTSPMLPRCIEFTSILGAKNIIIHPIQVPRYYGHEKEHFDMNMKFYRALAPYAKEYGVKIAIENMWQHHPVNHNIVDDVCSDPVEHVRYFDALDDGDAFTLCLDMGHVALCGREPEDAIRILGHDRLGCIHAHDVDYISDLHTLPGCGLLKWDEICRALGEIDYTGDFTLEADNFLRNVFTENKGAAVEYMAKVSHTMVKRIDSYRIK